MVKVRVCYKTIGVGEMDVHIRMLRDTLQFEDVDGVAEKLGICSAAWPLFGVVWPSSEVLAHLMLEYEIRGKRILEVGCGIALASLVLNNRSADITATDRHPEVEGFLAYNTELNQGKVIPLVRTGWAETTGSGLGVFDLIIGSDILYEQEHVKLLAAFINQHAGVRADVLIVDPGRGMRSKFAREMETYGFSFCQQDLKETDYLEKVYKGRILNFAR